jgi:methyl-accepting chemotaxis protein
MLDRMRITSRLACGFGLLMVLVAAVAGSATISAQRTAHAVAETRRTLDIVVRLKDSLLNVRQGRVQAWTYAATSDSSYLKARDDAFDRVRKQYTDLQPYLVEPVGRQLVKEYDDSVTDFEAKARAFNLLTAQGTPDVAPEYRAAIAQVNAAARKYAETSDRAANYYDDINARATAKADEEIELSRMLAMGAGAVGIVLGIVLAWTISRGIAVPVKAMTAAMGKLASGDLAVEIPAADNKDEIGDMAKAVQVFRDNARHVEQLRQTQGAERAAREKRAQVVEQLTVTFDSKMSDVLRTVEGASGELEMTAAAMSESADRTNRQAANVATATEQASASVQMVSTSADELAGSIQEIGRQVEQSSRISCGAAEEASRTSQTVRELAEASAKIGAVVQLINDIASQTNLLALNATIEAARAGDAGKGFAVVASEVKNLANQTARATDEIGAQIGAVQNRTQEAVSAITGIVSRIGEINHIASIIAAAVEEQSAATHEIARNVQQTARGTQNVAENIGGVSQAAEATGAASQQVLSSAKSLSGEAERLKEVVAAFLQGVKAA